MGANAQTSVPTFTAGQVLTAAQVNQINTGIPVFADATARDAAFGSTGEKTLALGQFAFLEDVKETQFYDGSSWTKLGGSMTKVEAFTASGTWTVPAGVTYAIAHIRGGGGGTGATAGAGGNSSVAFSGGTITATGGAASTATSTSAQNAGATNSGNGGSSIYFDAALALERTGQDGAYIVAGDDVSPAASITVTVGAGGTAGTGGAAGGSGYVWIEYQE